MVDRVVTGSPGIILTAFHVIFIVGIKCAPTKVDGVGGFYTVEKEYFKDERMVVSNYDWEQHVESLGETTKMIRAEV